MSSFHPEILSGTPAQVFKCPVSFSHANMVDSLSFELSFFVFSVHKKHSVSDTNDDISATQTSVLNCASPSTHKPDFGAYAHQHIPTTSLISSIM